MTVGVRHARVSLMLAYLWLKSTVLNTQVGFPHHAALLVATSSSSGAADPNKTARRPFRREATSPPHRLGFPKHTQAPSCLPAHVLLPIGRQLISSRSAKTPATSFPDQLVCMAPPPTDIFPCPLLALPNLSPYCRRPPLLFLFPFSALFYCLRLRHGVGALSTCVNGSVRRRRSVLGKRRNMYL